MIAPMRFIVVTAYLLGAITPAIGQASSEASASDRVRIDEFKVSRRGDSYGIASFMLFNGTDRPLNSIELNCWVDDDRAHATKVLVWPRQSAVAAHESQQFSNVNVGFVGAESRPQCEVAGVD
jgi:hypothetical protein